MSKPNTSLAAALQLLTGFSPNGLTARIADLEWRSRGCDGNGCAQMLADSGVTTDLLSAACAIKGAIGQINVIIHTLGILLVVPKILEPGERIEYVSLGAGNTGRRFDLETDRRIAEFKFINWQGGPEAIRQNALFKDFYLLAEHETQKCKELYVIGTTYPLQFLRGGRAISNVLSRNVKLKAEFEKKYGGRFERVVDYFQFRQHEVQLFDAAALVPELVVVASAIGQDESTE